MLDEMETTADSDAFPESAYSTEAMAAPSSGRLPHGVALGRFVITGYVGQGGMGQVYSAHDPDLNREVALKVIAQKAETSSSERFIREAQAASALNHPNIVTVYEVIRSGPRVAIAMELVTGTSLRHFCGTAQPVEKVALWGRQIAHALAAAHAGGIVHRDIKPENLMLRPDGYIKVLDFGLARQAGAERADGELAAGTLGYMSPEEILRRPITAASDIFSLGVVLYELASGTNPFRGDSAGATTRLIEGLEAPPLPAQGKGVPRELDRLVRVMLNKSAADRPTASEVASRLEAIAQPRRFRRNFWVAAALAIGALGGMAVWRGLPSHRADDKPILLQSLPLDSEPASETAPAFSPDGGSIVYASDLGSPGIHHIVTRSVARTGFRWGGIEPATHPDIGSAGRHESGLVARRLPDRVPAEDRHRGSRGDRDPRRWRTGTRDRESSRFPAGFAQVPDVGARRRSAGDRAPDESRFRAPLVSGSRFPVALNSRSPRDRMGHRMSPPHFPRMADGSLIFAGRMAPHTSFGLFRSSLVERRSCWSRVRFRLPRLRGSPTAEPSCMAVAQ